MTEASPSGGEAESALDSMLHAAVALHSRGQLIEAAQVYRDILGLSPCHFDAIHLLGVVDLQAGRPEAAQAMIQSALAINPNDPSAHNNLATAYLRSGRLEQALTAASRANELSPGTFDFLVTLGSVLHEMRRIREALVPLQQAYAMNPHSPPVCGLLGACLLKTENSRLAARVFESFAAEHPSDPNAWANLSVALNALGKHESAVENAHRALLLRPNSPMALSALAAAQFEMGQVEEAVETYRQAVEVSPSPKLLCEFANALITSGLHADALQHIQEALRLDPNHTVAHWLFTLAQLKPMPASGAEIESSRENFRVALKDMHNWYAAADPPEAFLAVGATEPFYIAYQPYNNRELLTQYGEECATWMRPLPLPRKSPRAVASHNKTRIGIASAHLRNHSVWVAILKGWIENLNRKHFDVYMYHLGLQSDAETSIARHHATRFEDEPTEVIGWASAIQRDEVDLLIYPAIGMDPLSIKLAAMRLARAQAASWGHPETSGLPTVDFFLSGEMLEPLNAQDNYAERLVKLPNLGVTVEPLKPKVVDANLAALNLPNDEPLLLCPGTPFKYSPLYDWVWVEIARGLKKPRGGKLVFFAANRGAMYKILTSRLQRVFGEAGLDFSASVRIVPYLERARFFGLMQRSTLMLDTLGFSGFNTALQAIESGLPILSFEGDFMRGRLASCLLRRMDIPELITNNPQQFVESAIQLAHDSALRKRLSKDIVKRRKVLFNDLEPVRALERFAVEAGRQG